MALEFMLDSYNTRLDDQPKPDTPKDYEPPKDKPIVIDRSKLPEYGTWRHDPEGWSRG
jgi:hypothetical protein